MAFEATIGRLVLTMDADARQLREEMRDTRQDVTQETRRMKNDVRDEIDSDGGLIGTGRGTFIGAQIDPRELAGDIIRTIRDQFVAGLEDAREFAEQIESGEFRNLTGLFTESSVANIRNFSSAMDDLGLALREMRAAGAAELLGPVADAVRTVVQLLESPAVQTWLRVTTGTLGALRALTGLDTTLGNLRNASLGIYGAPPPVEDVPAATREEIVGGARRGMAEAGGSRNALIAQAQIQRGIAASQDRNNALTEETNRLLREYLPRRGGRQRAQPAGLR